MLRSARDLAHEAKAIHGVCARQVDDPKLDRSRASQGHREILRTALERLRGNVEYTSLPAFLLNEPFTLPELQHGYEVVLARPLDKSAFRKRMLDAGFLQEVGTVPGAFGRAAMGYRVRERERATIFPRTFRSGE